MMKFPFTLLLFGLLTFSGSAEAKSGCCSWHGGVDYCSYSGYYMCNDGTESPSCTCGGYDYVPSYTVPTTPTCPLFSSYSYLYDRCECNYGYVLSGGSCISEDDACEDQYGYHASSSFGGKCSCDYGYRFNSAGTKCVSNEEYCEDLDWNAEYDYLSGSCQCKDGYKAGWSGSSCVRDYDNDDYTPLYVPSYAPSYSPSYSSCPANSHEDPKDDTMCLCDTGYALNKTKTACIISYEDCPKNSYVSPTDESKCICDGNYQWNASKTVCQSKAKVTKSTTKSSLVTKACKTGTSGKKCKCAGGYRVGKIDGKNLCVKK